MLDGNTSALLRLPILVLWGVVLATAATATPDSQEKPPPVGSAAQIQAAYADVAPVIDGVLDDEVWRRAVLVSDFRQRNPVDGAAASELTEARVAFDARNLYFGFAAYDSEPDKILARVRHRDGFIHFDDHIIIALDSYDDDRSAYIFDINPLGTQADALITDERLAFSDWNWEGVLHTQARITEHGWVLEVALPLTTIRFNDVDEPRMGVAFYRSIRRKNEEVTWPHIPQRYTNGIHQVSQYGAIEGLRDLRPARGVEVKPYGLIGGQSDSGQPPDLVSDAGVDMKIGLGSSLTLDLTYNTDFAQVEADNVQINLTRFRLFFPEKREFFLERARLFSFGDEGETEVFFSRRIGLGNDILGGARLTGEAGPLSIGALNLQTRNSDLLPGANNSVVRLRAELLPRTSLGMIFSNLQNSDSYNRVVGVDGVARFWSSSSVRFWAARGWDSETGEQGNGAGAVDLSLGNDRFGLDLGFTNIGGNFNPGLGFVSRRDYRSFDGAVRFSPRFESSDWARSFDIIGFGAYLEGQDGRKQTSLASALSLFTFESGERIGFAFDSTFERLDFPFFIRPGVKIPIGEYAFNEATVLANTNFSRPVAAQVFYSFGDFFGGTRRRLDGTLAFAPGPWLRLTLGASQNWISLPVSGGDFLTTILSANAGIAASRELFGNALIQYDNDSQTLQANVRVNWIHTPGSDLFLVFDTGYFLGDLFDPRATRWQRRTGVIKLTYLKAF